MDRPILFSTPMVRALLAGSKTQTRRVAKVVADPLFSGGGYVTQRRDTLGPRETGGHIGIGAGEGLHQACPYGSPGDRLWVRETWNHANVRPPIPEPFIYAADLGPTGVTRWAANWRPSIHMPRAASRITLEITGVRVERLRDISEADAMAEGIVALHGGGFGLPDGSHFHIVDPRICYWSLWESINGRASVEANPFVWAVEFAKGAQQP